MGIFQIKGFSYIFEYMNKYELSTSTIEKIDHYVYVLIDPRDWKTFYVWKGKNNRINDHIKGIFKENKKESEKNKRIDDILKSWKKVKQIIVKHWLSCKYEALKIESAIIDVLLWEGYKLTNIVKWHWSEETWIMDLEDIKIKYEAEEANFGEDLIILININFLYKKDMSYDDLYWVTRRSWRIAPKHANKTKLVCCVYRWIIREVFEITQPREIDQERCQRNPEQKPRYMFTWKLASENIRNKYLHKSVGNYWKQWAQMPIRYVNI